MKVYCPHALADRIGNGVFGFSSKMLEFFSMVYLHRLRKLGLLLYR